MSENIFQAHFRIYGSLIFMISCYDIDYAYKYLHNLNNKTFKNYFKIIKSNDSNKINEVYNKSDKKIIIFITKLPTPEIYTFDFIKEIFHIHLAVTNSFTKDTKDIETYISDIQKIPIKKFINVKTKNKINDEEKIYDDNVEEKIYKFMIELINKKLNNDDDKFPRMSQTGGKIILYGDRELNVDD
jgi:hypothetical protein